MQITVTAQMRNGLLWEAVKKLGSQAAVARYLGVSQQDFGRWLNLKHFPNPERSRRPKEYWENIDLKLIELLGKSFDDAFPVELRSQDALDLPTKVEISRDVPVERLLESNLSARLLESSDREIDNEKLHDRVEEAISKLTPNQAQTLRLRFGLADGVERTLEESGEEMGVCGQTVRTRELHALAKLRHPLIARTLKPFIDPQKGKPKLYRAVPSSNPKHSEHFSPVSKENQCFALDDGNQCGNKWYEVGLCRRHWDKYVAHEFRGISAALVRCKKCHKHVSQRNFLYDITACPKKTLWEGMEPME